jgi:hypothetical protein
METQEIQKAVIYSCFFNYNDSQKMRVSDEMEVSMTLREASNTFYMEYAGGMDCNHNSAGCSQFFSMNPEINFKLVEGVCQNLLISD